MKSSGSEQIPCSNWYSNDLTYSSELIDKAKIRLHEAYCIKNLYKCKQCNKVVEKKSKEEHESEFHSTSPCKLCSQLHEKCKMEEHLKCCPKRPRNCQYCEADFPADRYNEHIEICGSKTIHCPKCNKYITRKCWAEHQTLPCNTIIEKKPAENIVFITYNLV